MAPAKKGGEKRKGHFAITEVVTREHTVTINKYIHRVDLKTCVLWTLKETQKFAMKEMGTPDVCIVIRLSKSAQAKGIRNVLYHICVCLSRKRSKNEDSSNRVCILVTCVPVGT
ncbi:60S ribosomal protein L31-like [Lutra lutra]|uniref:60S ribosomal protein L31-like n=1 Tax=Lutra lutra TaxID=9657 RepID=UPI001FD34EDD|nr:60S ribosomal protein L31-like [Lutra lutra]